MCVMHRLRYYYLLMYIIGNVNKEKKSKRLYDTIKKKRSYLHFPFLDRNN